MRCHSPPQAAASGPHGPPRNVRIWANSKHQNCRLRREEHLLYLRVQLVRPESAGNHRKPAEKVEIHHHHSTPRVELQDHRKTNQDAKELLSRPVSKPNFQALSHHFKTESAQVTTTGQLGRRRGREPDRCRRLGRPELDGKVGSGSRVRVGSARKLRYPR